MEGPCSEFPRPMSPERMIMMMSLCEEPMSDEDMQISPEVFCVEERTLRYLKTVIDIITIFK